MFYALSAFLVLASAGLLSTKGINYSVEFRSGSVLKVHFNESNVTKEALEKALSVPLLAEKFQKSSIREIASGDLQGGAGIEYQISSAFIVDTGNETQADKLLELELRKTWPSATALEFRNIGPSIGDDLKDAALVSVVLSILVVLIYLAIRFDRRNAMVSVIGATHVVLVVLGVFAWQQVEFSSATIAAFLALIGYSLNDTIIIFDRIRENQKLMRKDTFETVINTSINQTLSRTIKTSLTTFLPVVTMYFLGGDGLHSFSLVMLVGLVVGTYTSVCLAAPILVDWQQDQTPESSQGVVA